ncbi:hypothetical protein EB796_008418 [Bugula neritina]|uniref:Uncharacterized protein n=1 Tax=Bugula neritina TaxID=10212 RepID=A0A7J7K4X8_BUGNE|nr:hypothetical protein EB796_008418 [Bugula neritina]
MLEGQPIIPKLVTSGVIQQIYPLHCLQDLKKLRKTWVFSFTSFQPLVCIFNLCIHVCNFLVCISKI